MKVILSITSYLLMLLFRKEKTEGRRKKCNKTKPVFLLVLFFAYLFCFNAKPKYAALNCFDGLLKVHSLQTKDC